MGLQRPNLVGLICWILIIGGFYGLVQALRSSGSPAFADSLGAFPYPAPVAIGILFGTRVLMVVTGICLYERQGWARYVYVVLMPIFFLNQYLGMGAAKTAEDAHKLMLHKAALGGMFLLFLLSIMILFLPVTRRYYYPPQYVDE